MKRLESKVEGAELFELKSFSIPVKFRSGELESVKIVESAGRALRVIKDGRIGYSTSTEEGDDELIKNALSASEFGDKATFGFPAKSEGSGVKTCDGELERLREGELIELGEQIIGGISDYDERLTVDLSLTKQVNQVSLVNSNGHELRERGTLLSLSIGIERAEEGDIFVFGESHSSRKRAEINPQDIVDSIIKRLRWTERIAKVESKEMPVLFTSWGTVVLLLPLVFGFNGKWVHLGMSPLRGRLGETTFDKRFSLIDDGRLDFASRSSPYDDEGVPTDKKSLIEKGEVKQFLYDLKTAGMAGVDSTGNGLKGGFRNPPTVAPTTWVIPEGDQSFDEMVKDIKEGIIVDQVLGLGQGNMMSGEFSNNVAVGYKIENGRIVGRVKNTMIAGNVYDLLKDKIIAIGDKAQWAREDFYGYSYKAPAISIDGVSVVSQ